MKSLSQVLDEFNSTQDWKIFKADGVNIKTSIVRGFKGNAVKLEYDFTLGTGYGGIQKKILLDLSENFQFTFYLKAESPDNNLEFKLLDSTGENVWWVNNKNYKFPTEWTKIKIKKRHINFAWGPAEDKSLKKIDRIEFTVASYVGGKGAVYIDDLQFEKLPPEDNSPIEFSPSASSLSGESVSLKKINDGKVDTEWKSSKKGVEDIFLFMGKKRELGGIVIDWDEKDYAKDFDVYLSEQKYASASGNSPDTAQDWTKVYSVRGALGNRSYIRLNEEDAASIKVELLKSSRGNGYGIKEVSLKNVDYSLDLNRFLINIAEDHQRGYYPRYFNEEGTFWTITGVNSDPKEALINEDGMVEVDKKQFSIEPFIFMNEKLITWNDVEKEQSLERNYLPVPSVLWKYGGLNLRVKVFSAGETNLPRHAEDMTGKNSTLYLIYTLKNNSTERKDGNFYLAVRPFQVNPYYQWLNVTGGAARISSIKYLSGKVFVNDDKVIIPVTKENNFGAEAFDQGDITSFISKNKMPDSIGITDKTGLAGGCLAYAFDLKSGEEKEIYVAVPFYKSEAGNENLNKIFIDSLLSATINFWENKTNHIKFNLPVSADKIINTYKSNLAYILINRDKAGIQPGSRSYERSWIRDGALTSSALLKSGIVDEVKEFIDWYSSYQYENGKVPCVVDSRGPDPVPENDSHGELIFLIKQFFNFTKDTSYLASKNENVIKAVNYLRELISQRSTGSYMDIDSLKAFYGILPESISHEGYSAKPMHSYWDDFFAMKGLKDAVEIQRILGDEKNYKSFLNTRDEFKKNLYNSLRLAIEKKKIDYIPGCVELGDFDAASTTIAIDPCNELKNLPEPYCRNTFEKYYSFFEKRKNPSTEWDAYTPYEVRTIGSFIFLNEKEKAHSLIDYFLKDQRPAGWNHWAEVVWKNPRTPKYIGDMPHTWVGSDFINAVRAMFVYENEYDSSLVIGAGLYQDWIDSPDGMSVENMPTHYGTLSYLIKKDKEKYLLKIYGKMDLPPGGIILKNFNETNLPEKILVNGKTINEFNGSGIIIKEFPANVEVFY
ncbi:MAG TPA: hypothetical protein VMT35_14555 [Ignavibacteriaceae bacterium]|nr:hypothetical protein [Ignavibacteriaceae bacterium]